jgi:hypothetical protein
MSTCFGSYSADSPGGAPLSIVKQYIEQQHRSARAGVNDADPYAWPRSEQS